MPKLNIKEGFQRNKKLPLIMALANKFLRKVGLVDAIDDNIEWDASHWKTSPGNLVKLLIMGTLTDIRAPLSHLKERLSEIDIGVFLEGANQHGEINEYNVGEALERIGKASPDAIFEKVAFNAVREYDVPMERQHSDTTTISFYGEYDLERLKLDAEEKKAVLKIEQGYNKDGRPGCNQVIVGNITNELGIPIATQTMDGSTSDIEWNKESLDYISRLGKEGYEGVYVADCKTVTNELVSRMNNPETKINFVSRCPANFENKLESKVIEQAYSNDKWENIGSISDASGATKYKGTSIIKDVCGAPTRLLVLESDTLSLQAEKSLEKQRQAAEEAVKKLESEEWHCQKDAKKALIRFKKTKSLQLFEYEFEIEEKIIEKWPRGRRGADTKPTLVTSYHLKCVKMSTLTAAAQSFKQNKSCLVLISNVMDMSNEKLLQTYKGQHVVENSFRQLKSPQLASVIYLQNPYRIKGLSMILHVSLLIRALIQFRLREGLKAYEENHPGETINAGWGGRPLKNPTFQLIYEHSRDTYFEYDRFTSEFSFEWPNEKTKVIITHLLSLLGFSLPDIIYY